MNPAITPERFYQVGGGMHPEARSYVLRKADQELLERVAAGDFCYVLTPRQMGKTSLVARAVAQLRRDDILGMTIDLQGKIDLSMTPEEFYAGLIDDFIREFNMPVDLNMWWEEHKLLGAVQRFSKFVSDEVLPYIPQKMVIFIDEIDQTLNLNFSDDFFAAIRSFYNARARNPAFQRLMFVLLGVASPQDLVKDRTQSPFNIGYRIDLTDFTFEEARKLAERFPRHGEASERLLERVLYWTGGHPYLTQKVCEFLVSDEQLDRGGQRIDRLIDLLFLSDAVWSDPNLANVRDRIVADRADPGRLLDLYSRVLSSEPLLDDERSPVHARLKLSGIVKVSPAGILIPANRIYERVFNLAWVDTIRRTRSDLRLSATDVLTTRVDVVQRSPSHNQPALRPEVKPWKAHVSERLQNWRARMEKHGEKSVYAFLAAVTLWPVVEATRAGAWSTLAALGGVVAGVGSNLLVARLQGWKDEADAARQIASDIAAEPALQAEVDAVLTALETIPLAQQALSESEHGWFFETLLDELAQRASLPRFATQLIGSGAVATSGGVAVGGNVQGNVYVGAPTRDPDAALAIYRRLLVDGCRHLSLRGLDVDASDPTGSQPRFDLAQVYVDLTTMSQVPVEGTKTRRRKTRDELREAHETRPLSALEAVVQHRRVVLLGDPGSGKSTFLTHLTLCLAAHSLDRHTGWLARLSSWPQQEADIIPVSIVLRDFARWLPEGDKKAEPRHLWDFLVSCLEAQNLAFVAEPLHDRLEKGRAILLLDGLDEIPTQRQRTFIRDAVAAFAGRYTKCRIVVTCRTLSYQSPAWQLGDFDSLTLAPFSEEQIERFIAGWHGELARLGTIKPGAVEGVTRHLRAAVRRPDLWRLASNPLLLTVMALVHTHKGRLPEARALLYEETVDLLLWRWEQVKVSGEDEAPALRQLLLQVGRTDVDLKRALWRLAYEAHQRGGTADAESVADIGELRLQKALVELHPDRSSDWAQQMIEVMKLRAGLLIERAPEVYTFPHRTFQEYLAGAHLSTDPHFAQRASRLMTDGPFWREVVLLAVGRLVYLNGETAKPLELVAELCPTQPDPMEVAWRQAWMAGDVLLEMGLNRVQDSALGRDLLDRVRQQLVVLLGGGYLSPVERTAAGNTLAHLGDPRFRADVWYLPNDDLLGFVKIPAGSFWMGSTKRDAEATADEMPRRKITLPDYYIGRYPVTVAQFRAFVVASGYQPEKQDCLDGLPNHPVVYVTWYEALKYCQWLTECLRTSEETPEPLASLLCQAGWYVTLPSEAEWEKAARGADGRIYPWGNMFDSNRANYDDTGINATSAVGCFPAGASPYGCLDMAGNVWEWTRSLWGKDWQKPDYQYSYKPRDGRENLEAERNVARVLRGGAFGYPLKLVRCAARSGLVPDSRLRSIGFRVVVLPCS